jgi:hypothetical protein
MGTGQATYSVNVEEKERGETEGRGAGSEREEKAEEYRWHTYFGILR